MGWFKKTCGLLGCSGSVKVDALEHEIVILKMQVAGLKKELADCDAFVTVLDAENKALKPDPKLPPGL